MTSFEGRNVRDFSDSIVCWGPSNAFSYAASEYNKSERSEHTIDRLSGSASVRLASPCHALSSPQLCQVSINQKMRNRRNRVRRLRACLDDEHSLCEHRRLYAFALRRRNAHSARVIPLPVQNFLVAFVAPLILPLFQSHAPLNPHSQVLKTRIGAQWFKRRIIKGPAPRPLPVAPLEPHECTIRFA